VVTSYLKEIETNYRACHLPGHFIRRGFFCDERLNCAADPGPGGPKDESSLSCGEGGGALAPSLAPDSLPSPPLNLLTITLVLVSSTLLLLAFTLLAVKLGQGCRCLQRPRTAPPELPDRAADPGHGLLRPRPRPHTLLHIAPHPQNAPSDPAPRRGTTPDSETEPPPAYSDLFPPGFTFVEEKNETETETEIAATESSPNLLPTEERSKARLNQQPS